MKDLREQVLLARGRQMRINCGDQMGGRKLRLIIVAIHESFNYVHDLSFDVLETQACKDLLDALASLNGLIK